MATMEDAIALAARAHKGQKDKAGAPYILHPLRMMLRLKSEAERIAAVLHDVVEDAGVTIEQLRAQGFSDEVLAAIEALTRRPGESYDEFIVRVAQNDLAQRVKLVDLEDNMDLGRLANPTDADRQRREKYQRAWQTLTSGRARRPVAPCSCHSDAYQTLSDFTALGMDDHFGEVSTAQCGRCGQQWLRYFYEIEAFTGSQRWYLGAISEEQAARLTVGSARVMLALLDVYFRGGSFFNGQVTKSAGELNLYP